MPKWPLTLSTYDWLLRRQKELEAELEEVDAALLAIERVRQDRRLAEGSLDAPLDTGKMAECLTGPTTELSPKSSETPTGSVSS